MTPAPSATANVAKPSKPLEAPVGPLAEGAVVGKVLIPRLHLSAIVLQGVEDNTLARGAGHVPSTAMPGQTGNFAIAAHRDTLFRPLRNIQKNDDVTFESTTGRYTYQVFSTQIVLPSDVGVLRPPPDGGKWLTLITCYPFYYVGSAPKRFIVQAKLVSADPDSKLTAHAGSDPPPPPPSTPVVEKRSKLKKQASLHEPRHMRGSSSFRNPSQAGFRKGSMRSPPRSDRFLPSSPGRSARSGGVSRASCSLRELISLCHCFDKVDHPAPQRAREGQCTHLKSPDYYGQALVGYQTRAGVVIGIIVDPKQ